MSKQRLIVAAALANLILHQEWTEPVLPTCQLGKVESLKRDEADVATKEYMSDDYCFLNPPEFLGLEKLRLETGAHPNGDLFRIAGFRWNDLEYWFMPRVISPEKLDCGLVYLYLKGGSRMYTSRLIVRPPLNRFKIDPPDFRKQPKRQTLIIDRFSKDDCVDIEFLKAEGKRLWARKYTATKADLKKIARPPLRHIV